MHAGVSMKWIHKLQWLRVVSLIQARGDWRVSMVATHRIACCTVEYGRYSPEGYLHPTSTELTQKLEKQKRSFLLLSNR